MKKPRLLLVDDDPLIAESLAFALQSEFDISPARDRGGAVERLREGFAPELALIDLGLPPVPHLPNEGFKLIGDLLAHAPDVRILVLTGQNEESNARRARALGAVDLVPKPCDPEFLRAALARALGAQPLELPEESAESALQTETSASSVQPAGNLLAPSPLTATNAPTNTPAVG